MHEDSVIPELPPEPSMEVTAERALISMMATGLASVGFDIILQAFPRALRSDRSSWIDGSYWLSGRAMCLK